MATFPPLVCGSKRSHLLRLLVQWVIVLVAMLVFIKLAEKKSVPARLNLPVQKTSIVWISGVPGPADKPFPDGDAWNPFDDPSEFSDPMIRPGPARMRDQSLLAPIPPSSPTLPQVSLLDYPMKTGELLLDQRQPETLPIPMLAESTPWIPAPQREVPDVGAVSKLRFEIEGGVTQSDLVYFPGGLESPPFSQDGVSRIRLGIDADGKVESFHLTEPGTSLENRRWLLGKIQQMRFASMPDSSGLREAVLIYYWENPQPESPPDLMD
jgi:hypothetical protein